MSTVDVIVPCYRYGRYLRECVRSALAQTGVDVRVLIIDDHSPDETPDVGLELVREDARVDYRRHSQNRGHIATYNEGIDWAQGDYLLLLSADDYLVPGALGRATTAMDSDPNIGFAFGKCIEKLASGVLVAPSTPAHDRRHGTYSMSGADFINVAGPRNIVPTPTAVVRTTLQKEVGGYLADLPHTGDMEMWLRLAAYADVAVINSFQAVYRRHETNMSLQYANRNTCVPDFMHRRDALETFFRSGGSRVPHAQDLHRQLLHSLGREAISSASSAFNDGNMSDCAELLQFALNLSPKLRRSLPWQKLRLKQIAGRRTWLKFHSLRKRGTGNVLRELADASAAQGEILR